MECKTCVSFSSRNPDYRKDKSSCAKCKEFSNYTLDLTALIPDQIKHPCDQDNGIDKMRAFFEGAEYENISSLLKLGKIGDFRQLGELTKMRIDLKIAKAHSRGKQEAADAVEQLLIEEFDPSGTCCLNKEIVEKIAKFRKAILITKSDEEEDPCESCGNSLPDEDCKLGEGGCDFYDKWIPKPGEEKSCEKK